MIVLVDTCVWSLALRRYNINLSGEESGVVALLSEVVLEGRARMPGVVRQELLSGVRHQAQFETLLAATRAFDDVPLTAADYEEAAVCDTLCRAGRISGSTTDFLLCAIALRRQWAILTVDKDFAHYGRKLDLQVLPGDPATSHEQPGDTPGI
jgi:predicted nucleic acid-binding protein